MLRKIALFAALVFSLGTASYADDESNPDNGRHGWQQGGLEVQITDSGYFPFITYLQAGDVVRIVNATETNKGIQARRFMNRWTTGTLEPGDTFYLVVGSDTQLSFEDIATSTVVGQFSFAAAPLQ
jgi:plastocyanin